MLLPYCGLENFHRDGQAFPIAAGSLLELAWNLL